MKSANEDTTARMHSTKARIRTKLKKPTQHSGTQQDASVSSTAKTCLVKTDRKPSRRQCSWPQEETDVLGLRQYWVSVGRKSQIPLSDFATLRMKRVVGETFIPLCCVILEGRVMLN